MKSDGELMIVCCCSDPSLCMWIAISLHFFFLAAFAWMFMEGYQIYVLLVKVTAQD